MRRKRRCGLSVIPMCAGKWGKSTPTWHLYKSRIIIQNFAQLKALFKDTWETIPGNCDTFIYLGGNEQSTHKYVSELLGKGTIDKKSSGETKGRQGSSSRNYV